MINRRFNLSNGWQGHQLRLELGNTFPAFDQCGNAIIGYNTVVLQLFKGLNRFGFLVPHRQQIVIERHILDIPG